MLKKRVHNGLFLCDRCGSYYSCVVWKCWVFTSPFYLCETCWDSFFRMVKTHPILQRLVPKVKFLSGGFKNGK
jgi:hypothetical protein